ncbi:hypothetical protein [Sporosarcina sp. FSL W7-1283]|uniref:hypothetical protein n=1 Tax=Sporosarcina sp. FSL W7-1283 TaxID=2921560 RepID=UPI0030FC06CD
MVNNEMISVGKIKEKHPRDMVNIELLEKYSHYARMYIRMPEEQDYIALLRQEILKRMD